MKTQLADEKGFVLVLVLVIMVGLVIIGVATTNTTNMEKLISGQEIVATESFYYAEAAAMSAVPVLKMDFAGDLADAGGNIGGYTLLPGPDGTFGLRDNPPLKDPVTLLQPADFSDLDFAADGDLYREQNGGETSVIVAKVLGGGAGRSKEFIVGYDTTQTGGRSAGGGGSGGVPFEYEVWSQHDGKLGTRAQVRLRYRHME